MRILVLDNYDSFTYNLVHYIKELTNEPVDVYRNDEISLEEVGKYDKILLSPGPGVPDEAGIMKELIAKYGETKSIFGVCLGVQAIAEVYGGSIYNLNKVYHGISTPVEINDTNDITFKGLPKKFEAGRYHSWVVSNKMPECLSISARDLDGQVMAIRHKTLDVRGVQFHPESVLTEHGHEMIKNWLEA